MVQQATIQLVDKSKYQEANLELINNLINDYIQSSTKIGQQLDWNYERVSFPYTISNKKLDDQDALYLQSNDSRYKHFVVSIQDDKNIVITLLPNSTYGDKGKANELCRYLAQKIEAKLELFNNRIMYFYKR
ncbi:DUF1885 family protein [Gottfriedia acidiceleris]|uniref:DUF1885 family protein n=1 Tax=Gottfriedia acidiceleris TaxID=371036 RepID=UPI002F26A5EC